MFKRTKISSGVLVAIGGAVQSTVLIAAGTMLVPAATLAQEATRIEITGSLIRRIEGETSLPVVTIRADDLARSGVTNAEQAVKFITQQQGGTVTSGSVSGTNGAAAYADLRSLGAGRTLVLINGKRMVSNPFSSLAVDLNSIPMAAIDRIETLPDGASATYGTDAIAGVINFVMKKSYKGGKVDVSLTKTEHGGGDVTTANLLLGLGDLNTQGWNIYGAFNFRDQKPMNGLEREFMRSSYQPALGFNGLSPTTFPANYTQVINPGAPAAQQTTITVNPSLAAGCLPVSSIAAPEANGTTIRCFADTQTFTNVVPVQEQLGALLKGTLALGPNHSASLEYIRTTNMVQTQIAPSPEGGLQVLPSSPFYPGGSAGVPTDPRLNTTLPVNVNWRTTVLGARAGKQENTTQRAALGLEGSLGEWFYQAAATWSNSFVENYFLNGYPTTVGLRAGVRGDGGNPNIGAPALNPFGAQTAAGLAFLQANQVLGKVQDGEGTMQGLTANVTGSVFKLPGGSAQLALGAEFRQEEMVYNTDIAKVSQAASSGLAGAGAVRQGDRDISAVAAELNLPIFKSLEATLSVRHDRYSDFGSTTNPKVALRYRPIDMLLLRGSYNTGFTAPTLTQLYAPNATTFTANRYNDPTLCPGGLVAPTGSAARDCGIQFQRLTGGNTALDAEKSKAWTIGFVLQPLPSLTVGLDFWSYNITNSISTVGEQSVFADPAKYAGLFVRCSQAPAARQQSIGACQNPGAGDPLAYIIDTNANLGDNKTDGVDLQISWTSGATAMGRFNASLRSSYVSRFQFQVEPGGRYFNPVGTYSPQWGGPVLRYQQVVTTSWERKDMVVSLANRFASGYNDQNANAAPFNREPFNTNVVTGYSLWDTSISYSGIKGLTLSLGVENLLDTDPPFTNQVGRFQARGYDDRFHNPLGRAYRVSAKYEF